MVTHLSAVQDQRCLSNISSVEPASCISLTHVIFCAKNNIEFGVCVSNRHSMGWQQEILLRSLQNESYVT